MTPMIPFAMIFASQQQNPLSFAVWLILAIVGLIFFIIFFKFGILWFQAFASGARVSFFSLIGMWLRNINPAIIVNSHIMAVKAGLNISSDILEAHYLSKGNLTNVIHALIAASQANIPLTFQRAAEIDLAGYDVLETIQTSESLLYDATAEENIVIQTNTPVKVVKVEDNCIVIQANTPIKVVKVEGNRVVVIAIGTGQSEG